MPGRNKKGARRERELVQLLHDHGYAVIRSPASGSATARVQPDVLAGNGVVFYAIEAKSSSGDPIYLDQNEILSLLYFSTNFGAIPKIGVRFDREDWRFHDPHRLYRTEGGNYRVKKETALEEGVTLEKLS